jgi:lipopolysaccharide export LptBFGC system permease protein LptF
VRILSRYFLFRYLFHFSVALAVATAVVTLLDIVGNVELIAERAPAAGGAAAYVLVRLRALYLGDLIPAASLVAALLCTGLAARSQETLAAAAGGVWLQGLAFPVLAAAAVLTGMAFLLNETSLLQASRDFARLEAPGAHVSFGQGSFWYHKDGRFYNVREADRRERILRGVRVFQVGADGHMEESLEADEVHIEPDGRWRVLRAERVELSRGKAPRSERIDDAVLAAAGAPDIDELDRSQRDLSLVELDEAIDAAGSPGNPQRARAVLNQRLAAPFAVLVFALVGLPLGFGVGRRQSLARAALIGIGALALFQAAWHLLATLAEGGLAPAAAPWALLGAYAAAGAGLLARAPS